MMGCDLAAYLRVKVPDLDVVCAGFDVKIQRPGNSDPERVFLVWGDYTPPGAAAKIVRAAFPTIPA